MGTEIRIRPFEDSDYPHVARTFASIFADMPFTEDDLRRMDRSRRNRIGITADDLASGLPVGFGIIWQARSTIGSSNGSYPLRLRRCGQTRETIDLTTWSFYAAVDSTRYGATDICGCLSTGQTPARWRT